MTDLSKNLMNRMKTNTKIVSFFVALLLFTSSSIPAKAQSTASNVVGKAVGYAAIGYFLYNAIASHKSNTPHKKYTPGEEFPASGYTLKSVMPTNVNSCTINKFEDNDSIYYMKVVLPYNRENSFFFMFLDKFNTNVILENTLNKENGSRMQRMTWLKNFLTRTKVTEVDRKGNDYWVYYKQKTVFTQNNPDAIPDPLVAGMGTLPFNYERAIEAVQEQKDRRNQWLYIGAVFLLMKQIGFRTSNHKYYYDGDYYNTWEEMDLRKRQNGDE